LALNTLLSARGSTIWQRCIEVRDGMLKPNRCTSVRSPLQKALGPDHPDVGTRLNNLAGLYEAQGRYVEAESHYKRDLVISEKALGADHPDVGINLNNLAALHFAQRNWLVAVDYWRRSTALIVRRTQRSTAEASQAFTGKRKSENEQLGFRFWA